MSQGGYTRTTASIDNPKLYALFVTKSKIIWIEMLYLHVQNFVFPSFTGQEHLLAWMNSHTEEIYQSTFGIHQINVVSF